MEWALYGREGPFFYDWLLLISEVAVVFIFGVVLMEMKLVSP